ncbi:Biotin-protein ligase [Candidatus Riesia pediculischaeffi PTSU]|uniref:Biotin-protein ligase n=1 Tax=Candidatus Riesia pediculischaeffi PTSU TaxID=1401651 RepID=A0A0C1VJS6_9ENTR|nr:Biotin-protein ligase [Candidatus Riesia pediculischaeffi PTSU]
MLDPRKIQNSVKYVNIFTKYVVDSTNQCLKRMLDDLKIGDVFLAEHQTDGVGKRGKKWFSSPGNSLCLSLYWKLHVELSAINQLSIIIGSTIVDLLNKRYNCKTVLRWPNDLFIQNKKVGGILIETVGILKEEVHCIIGIGMNLSDDESFSKKIKNGWISLKGTVEESEWNSMIISIIREIHRSMIMFENVYSTKQTRFIRELIYRFFDQNKR